MIHLMINIYSWAYYYKKCNKIWNYDSRYIVITDEIFMYKGIYMHRKISCFLLVAGATITSRIGFSLSVASFRCRVEWSYASCGLLRYTISKNSFEFIIFIEIQSDCVKLSIFMAEQKIFICFSIKFCVFK